MVRPPVTRENVKVDGRPHTIGIEIRFELTQINFQSLSKYVYGSFQSLAMPLAVLCPSWSIERRIHLSV